MIYFALYLLVCAEPFTCGWVQSEDFVSEAECHANGVEWIGGEIIDYKCTVKIRNIVVNPGRV